MPDCWIVIYSIQFSSNAWTKQRFFGFGQKSPVGAKEPFQPELFGQMKSSCFSSSLIATREDPMSMLILATLKHSIQLLESRELNNASVIASMNARIAMCPQVRKQTFHLIVDSSTIKFRLICCRTNHI